MKELLLIAILFVPALALAQNTPAALSTDSQQIENLIEQKGCQYEISASAQTIAQLQKQINELNAKLSKLDPPKSGATKH